MAYDSTGTELDEALRDWFKSIKSQTEDLTLLNRQDITRAGGKVFAKHLREETRAKHYSSHKDSAHGHAADHISASGVKDSGKNRYEIGATDVGWSDRYHAMNMMRVNDGTRKIHGDHFITNLQNDHSIVNEVLNAEKREYAKIVAKKQSQGQGGAS